MSVSRKIFFGVLAAGIALGVIIGLIKMVAPDAVSVSWNDSEVFGIQALIVATFSGAIPAAIFGLIAAGIASLFGRKKSKDQSE